MTSTDPKLPAGARPTRQRRAVAAVLRSFDDFRSAQDIHDLLRREFRVLKAHGAQEGLRLMQEEEVHIIMTDQRMPTISGVELLAKVKARKPQAVRMLFTGYSDLESIIAAINQGHIFQFLKKPWRPEELQEAVRLAAAEYDRLEHEAEAAESLRQEVRELKERVATLERLVLRLGQAAPEAASSA